MSYTEKIIVLSAKRYSMTDERGKLLEGVTVHYIPTTDLTPITVDRDNVGYQPNKASLPIDRWSDFRYAPAIYEVEFVMRTISGGKLGLVPADMTFISCLDGEVPGKK